MINIVWTNNYPETNKSCVECSKGDFNMQTCIRCNNATDCYLCDVIKESYLLLNHTGCSLNNC